MCTTFKAVRCWLVLLATVLLSSCLPNRMCIAQILPHSVNFPLYVFDNSGAGSGESLLRIASDGSVSVFKTEADFLAVGGGTDVNFAPNGIAVDGGRNVYVTLGTSSANEGVYRIDSSGTMSLLTSEAAITAVTGNSDVDLDGLTIGSNGNLFVTDGDDGLNGSFLLEINSSNGSVSVVVNEATLESRHGAEVNLVGNVAGPGGTVFVGDLDNRILQIESDGSSTVLAANNSLLDSPQYITRDVNGDLFVSEDNSTDSIVRVTSGGVVSTFISNASLTGLTGELAVSPEGLAFGPNGNLYVVDSVSDSVLRFDSTGGNGIVFVSAAEFQAVTGHIPSLGGSIAFTNPEPGTIVLMSTATAALAGYAIRRRRKKREGASDDDCETG